MRIWLLLAALAGMTAGCRHWVAVSDHAISSKEMAKLESRAVPAGQIGVSFSGSSVRWQEKAHAPGCVQVRLLPPEKRFSNQPMVRVRVNGGQSIPVVLDTGSPVNLVHASLALDNAVSIANPAELKNSFQGLSGSEVAYYGMIDRLALGEAWFENVFTAVRTHAYEEKLAGLLTIYRWQGNTLGMTTLLRLKYLTLDYPEAWAAFSANQPFPGPANVLLARIPFYFSQMKIHADIAVGENDAVPAIVDTGCEAGLMLPKNLVQSLGFARLAENGKPEKYASVGGGATLRSFRIPCMQIGGKTFTAIHAVETEDTFPVTLGSGFFKDFRITIDFQKRILWLEESKKKQA